MQTAYEVKLWIYYQNPQKHGPRVLRSIDPYSCHVVWVLHGIDGRVPACLVLPMLGSTEYGVAEGNANADCL